MSIVPPADPDDRRQRLRAAFSEKTALLRERAARTDSHGRISPEDAEAAKTAAGMKQPPPTAEKQEAEPLPPGDGGARTDQRPPLTGQDPAGLKAEIARAEKSGDTEQAWQLKRQLLTALREQ